MQIVVDSNESRTGIADLLRSSWDFVSVRRLPAGDFAIGSQILIERKTNVDFIASAVNGRLFRQAGLLTRRAERPIVILEGNPAELQQLTNEGSYRGLLLALSVGFRIPVIGTSDLRETAIVIRHMAAQESKREARRRRRQGTHALEPKAEEKSTTKHSGRRQPLPETIEILCAVEGIGRARAEALARHVQGVAELAKLGVGDLLAVPGIGPHTAARIVDVLREHRSRKVDSRGA